MECISVRDPETPEHLSHSCVDIYVSAYLTSVHGPPPFRSTQPSIPLSNCRRNNPQYLNRSCGRIGDRPTGNPTSMGLEFDIVRDRYPKYIPTLFRRNHMTNTWGARLHMKNCRGQGSLKLRTRDINDVNGATRHERPRCLGLRSPGSSTYLNRAKAEFRIRRTRRWAQTTRLPPRHNCPRAHHV